MPNESKLSHAGPKTVNRESGMPAPTGVGSSVLLGGKGVNIIKDSLEEARLECERRCRVARDAALARALARLR